MKRGIFKSIFIFILFTFVFSSSKVYAASASISASSSNVYTGDVVTIYVNINAGSWNLHVNGSVTGSIVGYDEDGNVTTNKSYSLNTSTPGTYTVTLSGDITDYDTELTTYPNQTITVTVNERPQVPQQEQQPSTSVPANNNGNSNINTNTNTNTNTNVQSNTKKTNEIKKDEIPEVKEEIKPELNITKFEIVGYELEFDKEKLEYSIDILEELKDLYIIVEGENIEVDNIGKVSVLDKNEIVIKVKNKDLEKEYKIVLNRIDKNKKKEKEKIITKKNDLNIFLLISTIILSISSILLSIVLIISKNKMKKVDTKKKDKVKKK